MREAASAIQYGEGILVARRDGQWIPFPVAVDFSSVGVGAVIGAAEKDVVIVLNEVAMKRFVEKDNELGDGEFNLGGADMGFAVGPVGRATGTEISLPGKGGLASSFVYTVSKGGLIESEITSSNVVPHKSTNKWFYGTESVKGILDGKVTLPDGSGVPEFMEKIDAMMIIKDCF